MATTNTAYETQPGVLDVYILDPLPGLKVHQVRVAPTGCLQFTPSRTPVVRWHNLTSWSRLWIVKILPDPDYLCCPDTYQVANPRHRVAGAPTFADFGPIPAGGSRAMQLPGYKAKPLHYRYDILASDQARKPTGKDGNCKVDGWNQDPHFVLQ